MTTATISRYSSAEKKLKKDLFIKKQPLYLQSE